MVPFTDLSVDVALEADRSRSHEPATACCCDVHFLGHEDRIMYPLEARSAKQTFGWCG